MLSIKGFSGNRRFRLILGLVFLAIVLVLGSFYIFREEEASNTATDDNSQYVNREDFFKEKASTPEGKRTYINQLQGEQRYDEAKKIAEELVAQTKSPSDATILQNICNLYINQGKEDCIKKANEVILKDIDKMEFFETYGAAEVAEKNGDKETAKKLYEHALKVYPPQSQISELPIKSQEDLKKYIETL